MKILSTYGVVDDTESISITSVKCILKSRPQNKLSAEDTRGGFLFSEIPPGESFVLELNVHLGQQNPQKIVVNWFCSATKTRGAFFYSPLENFFSGELDGRRIRESLILTPQLLDDEGRIVSTGEKSTLWLEGRQSYFPTVSYPEKEPFKHSFVHLDIDISSGKETIFSKDTVQAVYNINSNFCDSQTGSPYDGTPKYFSLYEVWRQLIEVVLNSEDIDDLHSDEKTDETKVVTVVKNILSAIFPKRSYMEVKKLRSDDYPTFCRHIQSYFFERCRQ